MDWKVFEKYDKVNEKYLPAVGEGEIMATQIATAVNKLVYKWYNDGDVYDNTFAMSGWCNDLSSYANWLFKYVKEARNILAGIASVKNDGEYEDLLYDLTEATLKMDVLEKYEVDAVGSVYDCDGCFKFEEEVDEWDDEEDDEWEF